MTNQDFQLCADFGIADKVREYCKDWPEAHLENARSALDTFEKIGVMGMFPFQNFALWATFVQGQKNHEADKRVMRVVIDTLYLMQAEAEAQR
jgi:hypothetical protein